MTDRALEHVRSLLGTLDANAVQLAAELLAGVQAAHDLLLPVAEHRNATGLAAGAAFQLLADLIASAEPPLAS